MSLILKNIIGRKVLLLISQSGMFLTMIATGVYFHLIAQNPDKIMPTSSFTSDIQNGRNISKLHEINQDSIFTRSWLLLPILQLFIFFYNIGLGGLIWTLTTELLPPR